MIELRQFATVGRSLVASQDFRPGETVLTDDVAIRWSEAAALPSDVDACLGEFATVPSFLANAVHAIATNVKDARAMRCVFDMHVPDLPISKATHQLYEFCRRYLDTRPELVHTLPESVPPRSIGGRNATDDPVVLLVHAAMAAKVNSHRGSNGDWCLFPTASKLAHSCDPNLFFVAPDAAGTCSFIATRFIRTGEALTFSYLGGPALRTAAPIRQKMLQSSHRFVCSCKRCRGEDRARMMRCPARCGSYEYASGVTFTQATTALSLPPFLSRRESPLTLTDSDAFPEKVWRCMNCKAAYTDADLKALLLEEERLIGSIDAVTPAAYKLDSLRELTVEVIGALGYGHFASLTMSFHMMQYFRLLVVNGCPDAFPVFMCWAGRYLDGLCLQGIERAGSTAATPEFVHMLTAAAILSMVATTMKGGVRQEHSDQFRPALGALAALAEPMISATYPNDPRAAAIAHVANGYLSEFGRELQPQDSPRPMSPNAEWPAEEGSTKILPTGVSRAILQHWPSEYRVHVGCPAESSQPASGSVTPSVPLGGFRKADTHSILKLCELWDAILSRRQARELLV